MVKDDLANLKSGWITYTVLALLYGIIFVVNLRAFNNPGYLAFIVYWAGLAIVFSFVNADGNS